MGGGVRDSFCPQAAHYIKSTIYDAKRMIGKSYEEVKADANNWPFEVCDDGTGKVLIKGTASIVGQECYVLVTVALFPHGCT